MSDSNQITEDTTNKTEQQVEILITYDKSDRKPSTSENDLQSKESLKILAEEIENENGSEYEDVDDQEQFDETIDTSVLTSVSNKSPVKTTTDDDELHINIKPRSLNKKSQDDEHSEGYEEDDDNQNVPNTKKSAKNKGSVDDDNDTRNPAYIPRKGKFYEHDDRTIDENDQSKQEISRNGQQSYKDSDAKWQHDLYYQDEQESKFQRSFPRQDRDHFRRGGYHQQNYNSNENYNKARDDRINNFHLEDNDRPRGGYNRNTNNSREAQEPMHRQRYDYNQRQIDEQTFHRRRNFTNSQFQQQRNVLKNNNYNRSNQVNDENLHEGKNRDLRRYENDNNVSSHRQINNNKQKQSLESNNINSTRSAEVQNIERPKRYSNMRNNFLQQQAPSSQLQSYKDQRSNNFEQNDWPQAPPPPISYLSSQVFHQQQTSRYVPMNYSQSSIPQQLQE